MNILEEAESLINGERQEQYGSATESFTRIADLWAGYLNTDVTEYDVVNLMVLLKVARTRDAYHRDSYVDIAGYAALGERLHHEEAASGVNKQQPRVWEVFQDIPPGTWVSDKYGDLWDSTPESHGSSDDYLFERNRLWGPFTEILETE